MKSFSKFKFIKENGSYSEIGILGCDRSVGPLDPGNDLWHGLVGSDGC
jgi:hypothetical protein